MRIARQLLDKLSKQKGNLRSSSTPGETRKDARVALIILRDGLELGRETLDRKMGHNWSMSFGKEDGFRFRRRGAARAWETMACNEDEFQFRRGGAPVGDERWRWLLIWKNGMSATLEEHELRR